MPTEAEIRDHLAKQLEVLEPGLSLLDKEFCLDAPVGAGGSIDILSKDSCGILVVIEIKRSNNSARAALHELHKYVALLKHRFGISEAKIRCILVSTEWHELRVPFAEYVRNVDYDARGFQITVDASGRVLTATRVESLPPAYELKLCPQHVVLVHESKALRIESLRRIEDAFLDLWIHDYLAIDLDHAGQNPNVHYPYATYLVVGALGPEAQRQVRERLELGAPHEQDGDETIEWEIEQEALGHVAAEGYGSRDGVTAEAGYPEKFRGLRQSWRVVSLFRSGRFRASALITTDEELMKSVAGLDGENPSVFQTIARPSIRLAWQNTVMNARASLEGNPTWAEAMPLYLAEIEAMASDSPVSISIYNPTCLTLTLSKYASARDPALLPELIVMYERPIDQVLVFMGGFIEWDMETYPRDPRETVGEMFGEHYPFTFGPQLGFQRHMDAEFMSRHGLRYMLVESILTRDGVRRIDRVELDGQGLRREKMATPVASLDRFVESNGDYCAALTSLVNEMVCEV